MGDAQPAHCTRHDRYEPGCVWCHSAAVNLARATRTFPEPSDPLLADDPELERVLADEMAAREPATSGPPVAVAFLPDDVGNARLLWMKGHRAQARRLLEDSRITDERARAVIQEHYDFTEAWIVDWERTHAAA